MTRAFGTIVFAALGLLLLPPAAMADDCLDCHREKTPAAVGQWRASAHFGKVECAGCHGTDHAGIEKRRGRVAIETCGACHPRAIREQTASRHGLGLHSGWGCTRNLPGRDEKGCSFCHEQGSTLPRTSVQCARFLAQSEAMREVGCNRCHRVESSCAACHSNHATDLRIVRDPAVCAKCHMGPDHPQWEMWRTSQHGTLYAAVGETMGPTCQRCHMPEGTHDVSIGVTTTPGMSLYPEEDLAARRDAMVRACARCHGERFAREELARGDAVREESLVLVKEAEEIIRGLADRGLLDPMPEERAPHPLAGRQLVLDGQMLYENTSHIERLFFKMKKYDLAKTVKGAYHQNPAYTHWYGNAELKMDLVDIRAEASRLRSRAGERNAPQEVTAPSPQERTEKELQVLRKRFDRGALDAEAYRREKARLLDSMFDGEPTERAPGARR